MTGNLTSKLQTERQHSREPSTAHHPTQLQRPEQPTQPPSRDGAMVPVSREAGIHPPQAPAARPEFITIANPHFTPTATTRKLKTWVPGVHHWILTRIPEQHQHLVNDVVKGDIDDLLVKAHGLAAREPKRYRKAIKTRMKSNQLDFRNFNPMAHQWMGTWPV